MLYVKMARPWAVAPSNCCSSVASKGIHSVGVRVTSCPRSIRALYKALLEVSASRCKWSFLLILWLQRGFSLNVCIDFHAVGIVKSQGFLYLGGRQIIIFCNFGRG